MLRSKFLGNGVSVKKLIELLEIMTGVSRLFFFNGNIFFNEKLLP